EELEKVGGVPTLHWVVSATASDMAGLALDILSGGSLESQVLVRTHTSYEPVLEFNSGSSLDMLTKYIVGQSDLGLVPTMRLKKMDTGCQLQACRSAFSLLLQRWDKCTHHRVEPVLAERRLS